jgi:hypothetical protein
LTLRMTQSLAHSAWGCSAILWDRETIDERR